MAQYGLGNYLYEVEVKDGAAHFDFFDPDDAGNTAQVTVNQNDFPEGVTDPTSRQVADIAFAKVAHDLDDARDARIRKQATSDLQEKHAEDKRQREASAEFINNADEVQTQTAKVDSDGTKVYNTDPGDGNAENKTSDKKK